MNNKIIILTASTGYGHNQVALAMKEELIARGCEVAILEPFKETSKSLDLILSDGYRVLATKLPKFYGQIYKMSNRKIIGKPVEFISIKAIEEKLEEIILYYMPDLVISTHPLIVKGMCSLKRKYKYFGPFISVITDYFPHKAYISPLVDAYIVGSKYTKINLIEKGIKEEKIFPFGIPIHRKFIKSETTMEKSEYFTVLLMAGSIGLKGIKKVYKELLEVKSPLKLIIVCGNNNRLKITLEESSIKIPYNKDIMILGFTDQVSELMQISDIIITKPGGLTVTEAFAKNIPMVIPFFIPGQEQENAELLINIGAAIKVKKIKELKGLIENFIDDRSIIEELKNNMKKVSVDYSLDNVINLCLNFMDKKDE